MAGLTYTHTGVGVLTLRIYGKSSSVFSASFSTFASLVQGHLNALNHLSSSSLLNPGQSGSKSELSVARCLVVAFHGLLFSARLCWLHNSLDACANSRGHTSSLPAHALYVGTSLPYTLPTQFKRQFRRGNKRGFLTLKTALLPVFFGGGCSSLWFLLVWHPPNLRGISKKIFTSISNIYSLNGHQLED